ncbi:uncharacterized protein LOC113497617 [Trichoplusia ni]|uniref:Uncharacterized protein LOC113497617 n=1 Tax=Trichoplusia ni TaxID=7111 RepID=A0A7E5VXF4_TRINI|nr:uncharacterized protein LOC113497617 [Trichoplusia ni]
MDFSVVILLSLSYIVHGFEYQKRCILYRKHCVDHCPRRMHPYHTRCDGQTMSQRTCAEPHTFVLGYTCGWSRCDCNGDLVLDENTGDCVQYHGCTMPLSKREKNRKRGKKKDWKLSKRLRLRNYEDPMDKYIRGPTP